VSGISAALRRAGRRQWEESAVLNITPAHLKYTQDHEWIRDDGGIFVIGVTEYAAEQLGDVTYVELPATEVAVDQHEEVATVESVKAASEVYAPVGGVITETNTALLERPELVNQSPYDEGWFFKLEEVDAAELDDLMDATEYEAFLKDQ